jgi:hypothetical protein
VGAVLLGLALVGCAGSGNTPSGETSRTTVSASAPASASPASASPAPVASSGWSAWTASYPATDGRCEATAHQVVCITGSGGFVGRSRSTGEVTWSVPPAGRGKDADLVVDSASERAVTSSGETLSAANLRTGKAAWTRRLTYGSTVPVVLRVAAGTVFVLETPAAGAKIITLAAFRMSDGKALWHRSVAAGPYGDMAAFGGRVYTTDYTKVTARDARTGATVATTPQGVECSYLISGGKYLVCTGSPISAGDTFPPLQRLDPDTLRPLKTAEDTGEKPERGVISSDGVLVLYEDSAEDPGAGSWNAYDLVHPKRLWSYDNTTEEAELAGDRFVTFTPRNVPAVRDRVISIDLHAGPKATGDAAPHMSARYSQARGGEGPRLVVPGGDPDHVVVQAITHRSLRSVPLP